LLAPHGAEHVVVVFAKRGLAVAHEVEGSHGRIVANHGPPASRTGDH